jgi:hypothetical protein
LLAQVYVELLGGRQIGMELAAQAVVAIEAAATPRCRPAKGRSAPRPTRPARRNWPPMRFPDFAQGPGVADLTEPRL